MKTIVRRRIVSALTAGIFAASAAPAWGKSPKEVFAKAAPSVVVVLALDSSGETSSQGSGVVVGKNAVATNCHVIEEAKSIAVRQAADTGGGESYRMDARVLTRDSERDLCLLFVEELSEPPAAPLAAMGKAKALTVGDEVFAIGAPKGLELSLSRGVVSQLRGVHGKRAAPLVQTDAAISPGSSGGGLFNENAELVGITTFKWKGESLNFAIPVEWVGEARKRAAEIEAALAAFRGTRPPHTKHFKAGELNADSPQHLIIAAEENDIDAARWLIANGAEVNAKNKWGYTPLHLAAGSNASEVAALLINNGAEVNAKNKNGGTPLHLAALNNASDVAALLINNGAAVNAKTDKHGWTPLHVLTESHASEVAALLVNNGAEINAKDNYGGTPLHKAAFYNASKVAALLINNGAEVNAKDNYGITPLDWAISEDHIEMQSFLRRHGGRCNVEC